MATPGAPTDPLQMLGAALAVPPDSKEQAELLATLRESLEAHPSPIPVLCTTLITTVSSAGDSLLKRWVLDLLHFAICRSNLPVETRTQRAWSFTSACDPPTNVRSRPTSLAERARRACGSRTRPKREHRKGRRAMFCYRVPPSVQENVRCTVCWMQYISLLTRICGLPFDAGALKGTCSSSGRCFPRRRLSYWASCGLPIHQTVSNYLLSSSCSASSSSRQEARATLG